MAEIVPLDQQVIEALTKPCASATAADVRALAEEALAGLLAEADAADVASLSPLAAHAQALELRSRATELRFEADRLEASVAALSARIADLKDEERRKVADAEHAATIAERDALAADIARDYPRIVRELTVLVQRIVASDIRCKAAGIRDTAEALGRRVPAHFYIGPTPVPRIIDVRLPMPGSDRLAWDYASVLDDRLTFRGLELPVADEPAPIVALAA